MVLEVLPQPKRQLRRKERRGKLMRKRELKEKQMQRKRRLKLNQGHLGSDCSKKEGKAQNIEGV
jgi:hypothetical protein